MLKTCFECLVGTNNSRVDHDTYGTRLNGHTQTTMTTIENEDIFILPRPLRNGDIISVLGNLSENKEKLYFHLKPGAPTQNNQNFVVRMEIDFSNDIITLVTNNSGPRDPASQRPSRILNTSEFWLKIQVREYDDSIILMDVAIGDNSLDLLELDRNILENITFFTLSYGVVEVKELSFRYDIN